MKNKFLLLLLSIVVLLTVTSCNKFKGGVYQYDSFSITYSSEEEKLTYLQGVSEQDYYNKVFESINSTYQGARLVLESRSHKVFYQRNDIEDMVKYYQIEGSKIYVYNDVNFTGNPIDTFKINNDMITIIKPIDENDIAFLVIKYIKKK